jgi:hypothetical protein
MNPAHITEKYVLTDMTVDSVAESLCNCPLAGLPDIDTTATGV